MEVYFPGMSLVTTAIEAHQDHSPDLLESGKAIGQAFSWMKELCWSWRTWMIVKEIILHDLELT